MALNSNIRNIPLLANCDLTNFKTDIHDFNGFAESNSIFLNKRLLPWWKESLSSGEITGDLRYETDEDYFTLFANNARIGKISRNYYNLEIVDSSAHEGETLTKVINPLTSNSYIIGGQIYSAENYIAYKVSSDYWVIGEIGTTNIKILSEVDGSVIASCTAGETVTATNFFAFIPESNINFNSLQLEDSGRERATLDSVDILEDYKYEFSCSFSLNTDEIFIQTGTTAFIYNLTNNVEVLDRNSMTIYCRYQYEASSEGDEEVSWNDKTNRTVVSSTKSSLLKNTNRVTFSGDTTSGYSWNFDSYFYVIFNGVDLTFVYGVQTKYIEVDLYGHTNLVQNAINNSLSGSVMYSSSFPSVTSLTPGIEFVETLEGQNKFTFYVKNVSNTNIYESIFFLTNGILDIKNYSIKYGPWAVNFIEKTAVNIAHDYKKLVLIEGEEDESGEVLSIDGYNANYIYYHYGEVFYRISIAKADELEDIMFTLKDYLIFNTTSYENALYINENKWFCSCDDWNSRFYLKSDAADNAETELSSRLNNEWQTLNEVVSVSDTIAPYINLLPVTATEVEAYDGGTWDGQSKVYDSNKNLVDTSGWTTGHSLSGYYYATAYETSASGLTPVFIDPTYTCPEYEDHNGDTQKQSYTIYFPKTIVGVTLSSMVQQGTIDIDGFTASLDEGNIFAIPEDEYSYQITPTLLNQNYLPYTSSVIVMNDEGAYKLMESSRLAYFVLVYLSDEIADPLSQGDSIFIINGVEYTYKAETNRILDYNGQWVCNTHLMRYVGFSSTVAYFFCEFDKSLYLFEGNNSLRKFCSLEKYKLAYTVYEDSAKIDVLNVSSLNLVLFNLTSCVGILYEDQFIVIQTGAINTWTISESTGVFVINNMKYSLLKEKLTSPSLVPIKIESLFYGSPDDEQNTINDCVYITLSDLHNIPYGSFKIKAEGLINDKIVQSDEKVLAIKKGDFNDYSSLLIKWQPKIQECRGFKFYIESDFEISAIKIGTSAGAMNQTTKRI